METADFAAILEGLPPETAEILKHRPEVLEMAREAAETAMTGAIGRVVEEAETARVAGEVESLLLESFTEEKLPELFSKCSELPYGKTLRFSLLVTPAGPELSTSPTRTITSGTRHAQEVSVNGQTYQSYRSACIATLDRPDTDGCGNAHKHHKCREELEREANRNPEFVVVTE